MESIAIIGIGCRFPGADSPEAFWQLLHHGIDSISEVPADRWSIDAFYDPEPATPGKMNTRYGGFLEQVDGFEPGFFGISPREAERMDPQQRLILEVSWEALENAGVVPSSLSGSRTGVFIGIGNYDYGILTSKNRDRINAYDGTGNSLGIAANRLSYLLNLRGPSLAIETACSSSLVAVHLACRSLQNADSDLCLVGAVSLMLSPEQTITYSQARMMASDGRCKTFDADADGYVRGEGCGIVALKRLTDAIRDGDNIQAVIRGSAINQDGLSNGLTAPNGPSQQAVIRQALENAGVEPAQISYVEAHGTGTSLGDPIEVRSLKAVLTQGRSLEQPCLIGSVKTNIGHLEAAAGMASLLKVVLSLQHQKIPPNLHLKKLNPYIGLDGTPFAIPTEIQPWDATRRFAGISSFGFGGTNAHLILEEAPANFDLPPKNDGLWVMGETPEDLSNSTLERSFHLLTLSAKSEQALSELAQRYVDFLAPHPEISLANVCFTANTGRSQFEHRLAVVAKSQSQLRSSLSAFVTKTEATGLVSGQARSKRPKIAFLFTGQGSQYVGMGKQLYEHSPVFRAEIDRCAQILDTQLDKSLLSILDSSLIDQTAYTQPALFALEYALFQLWKSWGIAPSVVMGHSVGEYVAACVAGVFSLEDGLKLIAARGRLMQQLPQSGQMVAVMATLPEVTAAIKLYENEVTIAAINGPRSIVISGTTSAVTYVVADLEAQGVKTKTLQVSHAFHSPLMTPMLAEFEQVANQVTYSVPQVPIVSNLTGQLVKEEIATPEYWCRHILSTVHFASSMETLAQHLTEVFVEIGPKPILLGMGRQCIPDTGQKWLPSLRPGEEDWQQLFSCLAQLFIQGVAVHWQGVDRDYQRRRIALPSYPFQRQRYWFGPNEVQTTSEVTQTSIVNWLEHGDIEQLTTEVISELTVEEARHLPKLLEVLVKQHQQQSKVESIKDLLYQVEWQIAARDNAKHFRSSSDRSEITKTSGNWLIFCDSAKRFSPKGYRQGVGQSLVELLGQNCLLVYPGEFYQQEEAGVWSINPSSPDDYKRLLAELAASELPLQRVVHLWSLEATQSELSLSDLEQAQTWGCESVLHLVQALADDFNKPQLWLVTQGAMPIDTTPAVAQAPLWGLGKVVALEHPEIWGGMVDLAPTPENQAAALLAEIWDSQGEDHLALRSGKRYVARLVPAERETRKVAFRSNGTYLITGGLGALGLKVAAWLVKQGVRHLVLTGRRGVSIQAQETIGSMEQAGAKVIVAQADVCDSQNMARLFAEIETSMPKLQGVFHTAGVVGYQVMQDMDRQTFESVLRPKVLGAWILHQLTQNMQLDFFVGFSSIASVWGSKGQAHYAAANQFLDVLASYRQKLGLAGSSVNWGPWANGGMASDEAQQWLSRMGVNLLPPLQALTALGVLLQGTQTVVADVDWTRFKGIYEARGKRSLLEKIKLPEKSEPKQEKSDISQKLAAANERSRVSILTAYLQAEVAKVLGMESQPEIQRGFFDLGMDSLMAVELKERLEVSFGASLPATLVFESPNIQALAEYLGSEVLGWQSLVIPLIPQEDTETLSQIEELSEDEVAASIIERLAKLESLVRGH